MISVQIFTQHSVNIISYINDKNSQIVKEMGILLPTGRKTPLLGTKPRTILEAGERKSDAGMHRFYMSSLEYILLFFLAALTFRFYAFRLRLALGLLRIAAFFFFGGRQPGSRAVVGRIESGALEHHTHRPDYLAQGVLVALRAALEWGVVEGLLSFEVNPAGFAPISINRHGFTISLPLPGAIIVPHLTCGKPSTRTCYNFLTN